MNSEHRTCNTQPPHESWQCPVSFQGLFMRVGYLIFFFFLISLMACNSPIAAVEAPLTDNCWNIKDTLTLSFDNADTESARQLFASFEFTEDYPFSNIYLWVNTISPAGVASKRPLEFDMMDEQGKWFGTGKEHRTLSLPLNLPQSFEEKGTYTIQLTHHMQDNRLCGVGKYGLEIR